MAHRSGCTRCRSARHAGGGLVTLYTRRGLSYRVAASAAPSFAAFVRAVENEGGAIKSIGGWRAHGSVAGSLHPLGLAIDINQEGRNRTSGFMRHVAALANSFGLVSGCAFRHPDCGHVEVAGISGAYARQTDRGERGGRRVARRRLARRFGHEARSVHARRFGRVAGVSPPSLRRAA